MERGPKSAAAILLGAAALIERRGLARNMLADEDGSLCMVRALQAQIVGGRWRVPWWDSVDQEPPDGYQEALNVTARFLGWPTWQSWHAVEDQLIAWNDSVATGAGQVVETLRGAAGLVAGTAAEVTS